MQWDRVIYNCSLLEFEQRLNKRITPPKYINKMRIAFSSKSKDRQFFGTLKKGRLRIYTMPNMEGPFFEKPSVFLRDGLSKWAAPAYLYGAVCEYEGQTFVDYYIAKGEFIPFFSISGSIILGLSTLGIIARIISDIMHNSIDCVIYLISFLFIFILSYMIILILRIPASERAVLLEFIQNIDSSAVNEHGDIGDCGSQK